LIKTLLSQPKVTKEEGKADASVDFIKAMATEGEGEERRQRLMTRPRMFGPWSRRPAWRKSGPAWRKRRKRRLRPRELDIWVGVHSFEGCH
jgi:hypothetical protein